MTRVVFGGGAIIVVVVTGRDGGLANGIVACPHVGTVARSWQRKRHREWDPERGEKQSLAAGI